MTDDKRKQKNSEVHPHRAINFKRIAEQLLGKTGEEKRRLLQEALKRRAEIAKSIKNSKNMKASDQANSSQVKSFDEWRIPIGLLDLGIEVAYADTENRNLVESIIRRTITIGEIELTKVKEVEVLEDSVMLPGGESVSLQTLRIGLLGSDSESRELMEEQLADVLRQGFLQAMRRPG
jgi:hypothetical protein